VSWTWWEPSNSNERTTPRLRLTTQRSQHTQHLLTTPRPPSATPPSLKSYATDYAAPSYNTKAPQYYTTEYTVPAYYTGVPKYYTTTNAAQAYYTEAPAYFNAKVVEATYYTTAYTATVYYTEEPKYYSAPSYYKTEALVYYIKPPSITT
jgi:hypothetical protein